MAKERIVVGATGDDHGARTAARRLRDEGHEIVFVGGHQTPDQLVRTAIAEDASRLVVDADLASMDRISELCAQMDLPDLRVHSVV